MVFGSVVIAAKVIYCVIFTEGVDRYVVELVLPENFVLSTKTLREYLV